MKEMGGEVLPSTAGRRDPAEDIDLTLPSADLGMTCAVSQFHWET